jgi:hypothetical protein
VIPATTGFVLTVTAVSAEVAEQPAVLVAVTEKLPAEVTVIDDVVAPLLHDNDPVALVDKVVDPQLFVTTTTGVACAAFGAEVPVPAPLTQPFTVCVTVYVALSVTVIDAVVALLLHRIEPVVLEAVNTDEPQLLATATVGADGIAFGAETPEPARLVQLPIVCVTV